jgi:hypothetical protein
MKGKIPEREGEAPLPYPIIAAGASFHDSVIP